MAKYAQSLNFGGYGPLGKDRLDEIERRRRAQGRGGPVIGAGATGNATSFLRQGGAQLRPGQALAFGQTGSDPGLVNLTSNIPSMIRSGTASPVGNAQEIMPRPAVTQQNRADYQSMLGQGAAPATDATGASPTARAASRLSEMEITKLSGFSPSQKSKRAQFVQERDARIAAEEAAKADKTEQLRLEGVAYDKAVGPAKVAAESRQTIAEGARAAKVEQIRMEHDNKIAQYRTVSGLNQVEAKQKAELDMDNDIRVASAEGDQERVTNLQAAQIAMLKIDREAEQRRAQTALEGKAFGDAPALEPVDAAKELGGGATQGDKDNNGIDDADVEANDAANLVRTYERVLKQSPDDPWVKNNAAVYELAKQKKAEWLKSKSSVKTGG